MKPHPGGLCDSKIKLADFINKLKKVELELQQAPSKRRSGLITQRNGILQSIQTLSSFLNKQGKLSLNEKKKLYRMGYLKPADVGGDLLV